LVNSFGNGVLRKLLRAGVKLKEFAPVPPKTGSGERLSVSKRFTGRTTGEIEPLEGLGAAGVAAGVELEPGGVYVPKMEMALLEPLE
jgi:hypothetical protein